ncbi:hypothetical protein IFT98_06840 [Pseudomonas sp. CFBP 8770]|uniref:hypothetical protein n=1 Tax=unclassified Pseudomonas TaxID=196821 RepID=UPI00177ACEA3|nr:MULTISPECIES: hypothetical protein [unclassified Pseudomonas]MBD8473569.1 hypothetical protein [Pseudomonas sp. CFBP 8773]MBD8646696.1 hypothetical protein [Pseudomonas sp. CFBP 8770]
MIRCLCAALAIAATGAMAVAAPAPWYIYQSLASGRYLCSQVDPGPHYRRFAGPFSNAGCRR